MKGPYWCSLLALQSALLLCFVVYLSSNKARLSSYVSRTMASRRLALDSEIENTIRLLERLNRPLKRAKPTSFLPYGPDETLPGKPAHIPKTFPVEEADFCKMRPGLDVIAYVHSSISGVKARNVTRQTWANASAFDLGVKVGAVFMVGRPKTEAEKIILREESSRYHDIVQGDYADHYRLLGYKGLAGIYWIHKHCPDVKWTLHADDDVYIDIFLYLQKIEALDEEHKKEFICSHMYGPALRSGRWKVSYEQYPLINFPLYCSGGVWFLQTKYLPLLLEAAKTVPFLWVDDAYLTGLLAKEADIGRHPFQRHYGHPKPELNEIGEKVAWFVLRESRLEVWGKIVEYHKNQKKINQTLVNTKEINKTLLAENIPTVENPKNIAKKLTNVIKPSN